MRISKDTDVSEYIVFDNASLEELLQTLNKKVNTNFGSGFALIVDKNGKLVGTVEDSDLRKFLSKSSKKVPLISEIMRKDFVSVENGLNQAEIIENIIQQMSSRGWNTTLPVKLIPILAEGKPTGLLDVEEINQAIQQIKNKHVVIGLGYVGLTLALSLAQLGRKVHGYDKDDLKIKSLKGGKSYILEPGIENLLKQNIGSNFIAKSEIESMVNEPGIRNIYFICVGTPLDQNKKPYLDLIWESTEELSKVLKKGDAIVMRSTVPIGTGRNVIRKIETELGWQVGVDFHYISAPERTVEGNALRELRELPQIIAGATETCHILGLNIFRNLANSVTSLNEIEGAELVKLMGNAFRDYNFAFSNYFIDTCQEYNLDINSLIEASNKGYPRSQIPLPSPGVGGPCLTKDSYFLQSSHSTEAPSPIINARRINELVPEKMVKFLERVIEGLSELECLAIGMAFKGVPETNDFRNSPSVDFINALKKKVKAIYIWDNALGKENIRLDFENDSADKEYDFFAILNNNPKNVDFLYERIKSNTKQNLVLLDPWRLITPSHLLFTSGTRKIHYVTLSFHELFEI